MCLAMFTAFDSFQGGSCVPPPPVRHPLWGTGQIWERAIQIVSRIFQHKKTKMTEQQDSTLTTQQEHTGKPHTKPWTTHHPYAKPEADAVNNPIAATGATLPETHLKMGS
jgi:hypothetical protein